MKRVMLFVAAVAVATPAVAQHVHEDMQAQAGPQAGAPAQGQTGTGTMAPGARGQGGPQVPPIDVPWNDAIPAGTAEHAARALKESPRHGEWVDIKMADGTALKSWVVYPERSTKSGVVLVIHDIRGISDIARAAGDQLAQDGFIAIVPDFLSGKGPNGGGTDSLGSGVGQAIQALTPDDVVARLNAAMDYGKKLPASNGKTGVVGFCWGGARSFGYAAAQPALNAAVVYYGDAPGASDGTIETKLAKPQGACPGFVCRQRRAHRRDDSGNRSGDEEAREELRDPHLRGRRARIYGSPGRRRRCESQGGAGVVAARREILRYES